MAEVNLDPVALINAAPATALCVLVYFELRQQRVLIRALADALKGQGDTLTAVQTAIDLIAQLVGVKIRRRSGAVPIVRVPDSEDE